MPRRRDIPVAHMGEVQREVHRCCRVLGVPGFAYHIEIVLADRRLSDGALGLATSPWHMEHVGERCGRRSRAGKPLLRLHYARWRRLTRAQRRYVVAHETAHLVADLRGWSVAHHGRRFQELLAQTQKRGGG